LLGAGSGKVPGGKEEMLEGGHESDCRIKGRIQNNKAI
jgi:hypothetical protein